MKFYLCRRDNSKLYISAVLKQMTGSSEKVLWIISIPAQRSNIIAMHCALSEMMTYSDQIIHDCDPSKTFHALDHTDIVVSPVVRINSTVSCHCRGAACVKKCGKVKDIFKNMEICTLHRGVM